MHIILRTRPGRDLARLLIRVGVARDRLEKALARELLAAVARSRGSH